MFEFSQLEKEEACESLHEPKVNEFCSLFEKVASSLSMMNMFSSSCEDGDAMDGVKL